MLSHSSHTNHEFLILVIRVINVGFCHSKFCHLQKRVDNDVTYKRELSTSKILGSFLFFKMANLSQIKL